MVEPLVVRGCISREMISLGASVLAQLAEESMPVYAAAWVYAPAPDSWRLVVAVPDGESIRHKEAHEQVFNVMYGKWKDTPGSEFHDFSVVDTDNPLAAAFRDVAARLPGDPGVRFSGRVLGGPYLEDAYIYRLNQP